jgi:ABC-type phosphate/phosphonate transport system substrate-binding protein
MYKITVLLFLLSKLIFANSTYSVGVINNRGFNNAIEKWQPTIDFLNVNIKNTTFELKPLSIKKLHEALSNKKLHFVLSNPGFFYDEQKSGLEPLTSLINKKRGKPYDQFGAVVFTTKDRTDINSYEDVKGQRFVAASKLGFGAFQMAWREFLEQNIDPFSDFKSIDFIGFPQDSVVLAVKSKKYDVGTVRTDIFERMEDAGVINSKDFKVISPKNLQNFPFMLSTRLYPDWVFSKTSKSSESIATKVKQTLLQIDENSTMAKSGKYVGWTDEKRLYELFNMDMNNLLKINTEDKYEGIDALMKKLKIGPYKIVK